MRYTGRLAGSALAGAALLLSVHGGAASAATLPALPITGLTQIIADSVHNHLFLSGGGSVVVTSLAGAKQGPSLFVGEAGAMATDGTTVYVALGGATDAIGTVNATSLAAAAPYALPAGDVPSGVAFQAGKIWVSYSNATAVPAVTGAIGYFAAGSATFHPAALTTVGTWPTPPRLAADPNPATEGTLVAVDNEADPTMTASFNVSGNAFRTTPLAENDAFAACTGLSDVAVAAGGAHFVLACSGSNTGLGYTSATLAPFAAANFASGASPDAVAIAPDNTGFATGTSGAAPALRVFKAAGTVTTDLPLAAANQTVAPAGLAWANDAVHLYAVLKSGGGYYLDSLVYPQYLASTLDLQNTGSGTWAAGTKVVLKGRLTYTSATGTTVIPPVNTTVRILRRLTNKNVNTTLYAHTGTGGAFTFGDVPPAAGSYYYVAYYPGTGLYSPAWHTVVDKVVIAHTRLWVTTGTTAVKKGTWITVTAHLAKWHNNKTVVIYARVPNGHWVGIRRALVSPKGILTVRFRVWKKTQFTAYYNGDSWYAAAHAPIVTVNAR